MILRILFLSFFVIGCGGRTTPVTPKLELLAADSARATLLAALFDAPPETLHVAVTPPMPRGSRPPSAVVIAFAVDSMGNPAVESMTIVYLEAERAYAKQVCAAIPRLRYAPVAKSGPFLMLVPFVSFSPPMPASYDGLYARVKEKLENMSTVERRDFFLDRGCRQYR